MWQFFETTDMNYNDKYTEIKKLLQRREVMVKSSENWNNSESEGRKFGKEECCVTFEGDDGGGGDGGGNDME